MRPASLAAIGGAMLIAGTLAPPVVSADARVWIGCDYFPQGGNSCGVTGKPKQCDRNGPDTDGDGLSDDCERYCYASGANPGGFPQFPNCDSNYEFYCEWTTSPDGADVCFTDVLHQQGPGEGGLAVVLVYHGPLDPLATLGCYDQGCYGASLISGPGTRECVFIELPGNDVLVCAPWMRPPRSTGSSPRGIVN